MKTKIFVFEAKTPYELVKKVNEDRREFFASQIFQKGTGWVAFCYYRAAPSIEIKK